MKTHLLPIILFFTILAACTPQAIATHQQAPTTTLTSTSTALPATPSATNMPSSLAPTTTPQTNRTVQVEKCIRIEAQLPTDLTLSGVWVYNPGSPTLENLSDHMIYKIPLKGGGWLSTEAGDMAISPDGTHMAYIDKYLDAENKYQTEKRLLRVVRSSGHSLDMEYWNATQSWQWIIGWADDQNLVIATARKEIVILNPLTGQYHTFDQPEWVDFNKKEQRYLWNTPRYPLYNPSLNWILEHPDNQTLQVKNVQTGESIWEYEFNDWLDWSWTANQDTAAIRLNGAITLLHNNQTININLKPLVYDYIDAILISPDGQKLVLNGSKDQSQRPSILDINQNKLTSLCESEFQSWWRTVPSWSPDSRFVIANMYSDRDYRSVDVLIDTQQMRAYQLETREYRQRVAWLAQP